jgi:hypothetical protein
MFKGGAQESIPWLLKRLQLLAQVLELAANSEFVASRSGHCFICEAFFYYVKITVGLAEFKSSYLYIRITVYWMFGLAARVPKAKPQLIIYGMVDNSRILPSPTQAEREAASTVHRICQTIPLTLLVVTSHRNCLILINNLCANNSL